jgi:hypothetical protein
MWYDTLLYRVQLGGKQGRPGPLQSTVHTLTETQTRIEETRVAEGEYRKETS